MLDLVAPIALMERVGNRRPPCHGGGRFAPIHLTLLPNSDDAEISAQLPALRTYAFDEQDRSILEAQQRAYDLAGGRDSLRPVMLSIDAAPLRASRVWRRSSKSKIKKDGIRTMANECS